MVKYVLTYEPVENITLLIKVFSLNGRYLGRIQNEFGICAGTYLLVVNFKEGFCPPGMFTLEKINRDIFFDGMSIFCRFCKKNGLKKN